MLKLVNKEDLIQFVRRSAKFIYPYKYLNYLFCFTYGNTENINVYSSSAWYKMFSVPFFFFFLKHYQVSDNAYSLYKY